MGSTRVLLDKSSSVTERSLVSRNSKDAAAKKYKVVLKTHTNIIDIAKESDYATFRGIELLIRFNLLITIYSG